MKVAAASLLLLFTTLLHPAAAVFKPKSLAVGFYDTSCPNAESVVRQTIAANYDLNPAVAAGLIRLFLHDCFVRGCDASVLLDQTNTGEPVEKDSPANGNTLFGLDALDEAKLIIEAQCPQVVSCADILAFATRDAMELAGLTRFDVPAGRRDGTVSRVEEVLVNLPTPFSQMSNLTDLFGRKGFTKKEMAILSGAHSIGGTQCAFFSHRLYHDIPGLGADMQIEPKYADVLRTVCPEEGSDRKVNFDPDSPLILDASYYGTLEQNKGLLLTDQLLMTNRATRNVVKRMADNPEVWAEKFTKLMIKMGTLDVLVGSDGEIRRSCRFPNPPTNLQ